jgi:hypothetical protein
MIFIKKLKNSQMLNYYNDPKPWIEKAKGVITITGSGAYECALMGKRAIVFGDVPFKLIDGVTRVKSFEELPNLIRSFGPIDNTKSCASYLRAIKIVGMKLNLKYLIKEGEEILKGNKKISKKYQKGIDELEEFYEKAFIRYNNSIN